MDSPSDNPLGGSLLSLTGAGELGGGQSHPWEVFEGAGSPFWEPIWVGTQIFPSTPSPSLPPSPVLQLSLNSGSGFLGQSSSPQPINPVRSN